jgi:hypothetical protein
VILEKLVHEAEGGGGGGLIGSGALGALHMLLVQYSCVLKAELLSQEANCLHVPLFAEQLVGVCGVGHPIRKAALQLIENVPRNAWKGFGFHFFYSELDGIVD